VLTKRLLCPGVKSKVKCVFAVVNRPDVKTKVRLEADGGWNSFSDEEEELYPEEVEVPPLEVELVEVEVDVDVRSGQAELYESSLE